MYKVFNLLDLCVMTTDDEMEADFFAWVHNGYYVKGEG